MDDYSTVHGNGASLLGNYAFYGVG